ncbi:MAG TPA: hypothetical protein VKE70_28395 [Candidatus Solibacter sp.]|nr:hypothetical protein [Candidatus Solibacter sp.]
MGSLGLLARHFFGRFFDNEIVSQNSDMRTNVVQMIGLVATPGMFVPFYMIPQRTRFDQPFLHNWILLSDYYFFVLYSMVVMGFVMVFEWDAIFPDRKDYIILTPLPLSGGAIFTGKTLALIAFLGLFLLDANFFCTLLGPLVSGGQGTGAPIVWKLIAVHAAAVGGGGVFVVLSIASIQGVLINLLPGRAFRRISPWVQMTVMGLLIVVLFLTPLMCASIRPLVEHRSPLLRWFPPFWFLSLYLDMLPGQPAGPLFHQIAPLATQGLTLAFALFAITYLAGYHRHARRVMEGVDVAPNGPSRLRAWFDGAVNRCLLLHPLERATFHFISNTILRNAKQRLFLATYGGIAIALALPAIVRISTRASAPLLIFDAAGLLSVPLTLSFFVVSGLRAVFNFPAELRANWIFQICESEERVPHLRAVRKWILLMGVAPLFAVLAPIEIWFRGWALAFVHITFALLLSMVLLNLLLVWFRKIPFTCSYFPGKTSMSVMFFVYLAGFATYSWSMADVEARLIRAPASLVLFCAIAGAAIWGLTRLERRERDIDDVLIYEDEPDPVVRSLELG